jgi:hypothetical protein
VTDLRYLLDRIGIESFAALAAMDADEVIRRLDEKQPPIHTADAFLAVMVIAAVRDLRRTTEELDAAKRSFGRATLVLAVLGVLVAIVGLF